MYGGVSHCLGVACSGGPVTDATQQQLKRQYWFPGGRHDPLSHMMVEAIAQHEGPLTLWVRLFFYLMTKSEPDGKVPVTLAQASRELGLTEGNRDVYRAANVLKAKNFIATDGSVIYLNPQIRYFGQFKDGSYTRAIERYLKLRLTTNRKERT